MSRIEIDGVARPGGFALTEQAMNLCNLPPGSKILDVGCGSGATVRLLRNKGFKAIGIDKQPDSADSYIMQGVAEEMDFDDETFDAVFFECSLSKTEDPEQSVLEAARVLRQGGYLILTDMYAKGRRGEYGGLLGRLDNRELIEARVGAHGLALQVWEDHTPALTEFWAQLVFIYGTQALYGEMGTDKDDLKKADCGYYLAIAKKMTPCPTPMIPWIRSLTGITDIGEKLTPSKLYAWQIQQVKKTIEYARANSPFYKNHLKNIDETSMSNYQDMQRLPFTSDADIIEHGKQMLCVSLSEIPRITSLPTSGSTGAYKRIYFTENDLERTIDFFAHGMMNLVCRDDAVLICLTTPAENSIADLLKRALDRIGVKAVIHGNIQDIDAAAKAAQNAQFLVGLPAEMLRLCRQYPDLRPKSVMLSADYIPQSVEEVLKNTWHCAVIHHFGMTETCYGGAVQCPQQEGMHIRDADFLLEIVHPHTGAQVPFGQSGELVITTLRNEAMPLLRYQTGDIASLVPGACRCGGPLHRLGRIQGRKANLENRWNIHLLDELMFAKPGLLGYTAEVHDNVLLLTIDGPRQELNDIEHIFECKVFSLYRKLPSFLGAKRQIIIK